MDTGAERQALDIASANLMRATAFLGAGLRLPDLALAARAIEGPCRAKVLGNGLRELDRLLNILIDAVARLSAPACFDRAAFGRIRNTSNKLSMINEIMGRPSPQCERLRAIGRSRACLFYNAGIVRRGDERDGTIMTAGWLLRAYDIGEILSFTPNDLSEICEFYEDLATDLSVNSMAALPIR